MDMFVQVCKDVYKVSFTLFEMKERKEIKNSKRKKKKTVKCSLTVMRSHENDGGFGQGFPNSMS